MAGIVLDFHNHPTAKARWKDMERFRELQALGLVPGGVPFAGSVEMPSDVDPFDSAYFAPEQDPA